MPISPGKSIQQAALTPEEQDELTRLASLYSDAKMIILYVEEVDPSFAANIQVIKELRDAFDHVMRLFIKKSTSDENGSYGLAQIDKAVGHVYRAAFDALDGTVLSLKIEINKCLEAYDIEVIKEILPNYWEIKQLVYKLSDQISENRNGKDVEKSHTDLFNKYVSEVEDLKKAYRQILDAGSTLDECQQNFLSRKRKEENSWWKNNTTSNIIAAVIGGLIILSVQKLF